MGMPRRYYSYPEQYWPLNVASTAGASVLALGLLLVLVYMLVSLRHGAIAGGNPWGSRGFEWDTPSPPPPENYEVTPVYTHEPHLYDEAALAERTHRPAPEAKHAS
jgi:cytochrome c oxidase subunit I